MRSCIIAFCIPPPPNPFPPRPFNLWTPAVLKRAAAAISLISTGIFTINQIKIPSGCVHDEQHRVKLTKINRVITKSRHESPSAGTFSMGDDLFTERRSFSVRYASHLLKKSNTKERSEIANCQSNQIFICKFATASQRSGPAIINSFRSSDPYRESHLFHVVRKRTELARNLYQYF